MKLRIRGESEREEEREVWLEKTHNGVALCVSRPKALPHNSWYVVKLTNDGELKTYGSMQLDGWLRVDEYDGRPTIGRCV